MISEFQGENRWLSNFWPAKIELWELKFPSAENAYQAAKCLYEEDMAQFESCSAGVAKIKGRNVKMIPGWDGLKLGLMEEIVRQKFSDKNPELKAKLLLTGDQELVEGNQWGDRYWGVCRGVGQNHLGKILMKVRKEIADVPHPV